jgi:hypothetical protein
MSTQPLVSQKCTKAGAKHFFLYLLWGLNKLSFCGGSPQHAIKLFFNTFFASCA